MEMVAIIILGISTLVSFSTTKQKSKSKIDNYHNDDPDWAFTQSGNFDHNSSDR